MPPERETGHAERPTVLVTDAWHPQVNGVVQTWTYVRREFAAAGVDLEVIHPGGSRGVAVPGEPGLSLSLEPRRHLRRGLAGRVPAALHIATEGPLGWAARSLALRNGWPFTTSYHTRFPEYLEARFGLPAGWTRGVMRRFHRPSRAVLVPTPAMARELEAVGFGGVRVWSRGVDGELFRTGDRGALDLPRPIFLYAGRVAKEKNLEAFTGLDLPGSKVVVGDGPERARLAARYPNVHWLGMRRHDRLQPLYDAADVFVFPSLTDTFGLVMLEAMACGCPVAAFPVTGPIDVVTPGVSGVLDSDLARACAAALALDRQVVRTAALRRTWSGIAAELRATMVPIEPQLAGAVAVA